MIVKWTIVLSMWVSDRGLAIAAAIASAHGGRIEAESTVGVGSSFWVELPVISDDRVSAGPA